MDFPKKIFTVCLWVLVTFPFSLQAQNDLAHLNDEFDDSSTISNWQRFHEAEGWPDRLINLSINENSSGALFMEPTSSGWFHDLDSPFLFKEVEGDFIVTTRVRATGNNFISPQRTYSLAGIFIRAPRNITPESWVPGVEDWMFISTGAGDVPGVAKFEVKNTVDSNSILELSAADTGWVELRLQRLNEVYTINYRFDGQDWAHLRTYEPPERPIMPQRLQVGMVAYTDWESIQQYVGTPFQYKNIVVDGEPDLRAYFDYYRFDRPVTVSNEEEQNVNRFYLHQNYPNPFNPETVIRFEVSASSKIEINVRDVLGRDVEQVANSVMSAGMHEAVFKGSHLPTGIYFYQLKVNGQIMGVRKMLLLK